ncbi:magnesium transporter [Terrarubrum flagellatum]|uniref:magnesium transporter n=1 Tax=Terrirubrum flagellatum TaxID=2895980 RepID=UPI0031455ED2
MQDEASQTLLAPLPFRNADDEVSPEFVEAVSAAIEAADGARLRVLTEDLHESDLGALVEALPHDHRPRLVELLGRDFDFAALTEVDDAVREDILEELETETVAEGVKELDSDDAVAILEDLDEQDKAEVLEQLPPGDRIVLQRQLDYPEGSAGRLMQTDVIAVAPFWTVGQTIDFMRDTPDLPDIFYEIFVVDPTHKLVGAVFLDRLLRTKRPVRMDEILADEVHKVRATDDREEVARLFKQYNLVSAPVIDDYERLVGVVMHDDILDVVEEQVDQDLRALGGVKAEEELSDKVLFITKSRFAWLFVNLMTAFLASLVLKGFEDELQKMVALAVLAPIVASQGGNAATQTMTVAVRALATRELSSSNRMRVISRELLVGLLNGLAFAVITGSIAALWFGTFDLGVVIGIAMIINLLAAALAGILIPLAIDRFDADPAVASGPFVTTVTDIVGFFSFLGTATLWFGLK